MYPERDYYDSGELSNVEDYEEVVLNEDSTDLSEEEEDSHSYPTDCGEVDYEDLVNYSDDSSQEGLEGKEPDCLAVVIGVKDGFCLVQTLPTSEKNCRYYKLDTESYCLEIGEKTSMPGIFVFLKIDGVVDLPKKEHLPEMDADKMKLTSVWITQRIAYYHIDRLAVAYYEYNGRFVTGTKEDREKRYRDRHETGYFGEETMEPTVVLVVQPDTGYPKVIEVVGEPARKGFLALCSFKVEMNQFVKARVMKSVPFFTLRFMFGTLCLLKNHKEEDEYNQWEKTNKERYATHRELITEMYKKENLFKESITEKNIEKESLLLSTYRSCRAPRDGLPLLLNFEKLTNKELQLIKTQCRGVKDISLEMARLYIRDPAYICSRVINFETWRKAQQFKVEEKMMCYISGRNYNMEMILEKKEAERVTKQKEDGCWKVGSELKIEHDALKRQRIGMHGVQTKRTALIRINTIQNRADGSVKFTFVPAPSSLEIFDVLCDAKKKFEGPPPTVSPKDQDSSSDNIALGLKNFDKLFGNKKLFNRYRGVVYDEEEVNDVVEDGAYKVMNMMRNVDLDSDISDIVLDEFQRAALHAALNNPFFTAIEAPPGTGKTHLISTLKVKSHAYRPHKRMMVTATTNNAINNAVEKTVTMRPGYHIIRDMSIQGEMAASDLLREYTLNTRCQRPLPDDCILGQEVKLKEKLARAFFEHKVAKRSFENRNFGPFKRLSILELIHDTHSILKRTYLQAAVPYVVASTPTILNRHGRHYDPESRYSARGHSASSSISHLVVDEASQLPAYMALALYCSFPYLERITIIGDSKQLGPHCSWVPFQNRRSGLLYDLTSQSELDRVTALSTTSTCRLFINYRCHPSLNDQLLSPIYKADLRSGLQESQRSLHLTHSLPVSSFVGNSNVYPIRFYNIEGNGEDGYNVWEQTGVINLLSNLLLYAKPNERLDRKDVVVLCFHKRQRFEIEKAIKEYLPDHSKKKEEIRVSTIDSYQGKEAKVVLVCTTKTCKNLKDVVWKMMFVADSRRCTVALSRAQEAVYIFGQWNKLLKTPFWRQYEHLIINGFMQTTFGILRQKKPNSDEENSPDANKAKSCW